MNIDDKALDLETRINRTTYYLTSNNYKQIEGSLGAILLNQLAIMKKLKDNENI